VFGGLFIEHVVAAWGRGRLGRFIRGYGVSGPACGGTVGDDAEHVQAALQEDDQGSDKSCGATGHEAVADASVPRLLVLVVIDHEFRGRPLGSAWVTAGQLKRETRNPRLYRPPMVLSVTNGERTEEGDSDAQYPATVVRAVGRSGSGSRSFGDFSLYESNAASVRTMTNRPLANSDMTSMRAVVVMGVYPLSSGKQRCPAQVQEAKVSRQLCRR
jgi:hypothetical protein